MERAFLASSLAALVATAVSCAPASDTEQAAEEGAASEMAVATYEGVLVDTKCFSMDAVNVSNDHRTPDGTMAGCATACAVMGIPVALLVDGEPSGEVLVLVAPSQSLADHMAKWARVSGEVAPDGGAIIPSRVEVRGEDGTYSEVQIATMM